MVVFPKIEEIFSGIKGYVDSSFCHTASYSFIKSLPNETKVCLACSGGSDSVFLVLLFCAYFPNLAKNASILHLNHNLRGKESDDDEQYVKNLAEQLGLNFFSGKLKNIETFYSEGTLHDIRHKFFAEKMCSIGSNILLLGQQKNDIAETVIMRLSRASGLDGLSAPHEIRKFSNGQIRIRPILFISKVKIESILSNLGISWRIDSSNLQCDYFRNKVRNVVLKAIQEFAKQYDIVENFAESQKQIVEANEAIEMFASKHLAKMEITNKLNLSEIRHLPVAILRRILNKWLAHNNISVKKTEFDSLLQQIREKETSVFNCLENKQLQLKSDILKVVHQNQRSHTKPFSIQWIHGEIFLPNGKSLRKRLFTIDQKSLKKILRCDTSSEAYIAFSETLTVKNFCADEQYTRFGHSTPKKLKAFLGNKIEYFKEEPMLYINRDICWIPGLSVADTYKIKANHKHALLLTYS